MREFNNLTILAIDTSCDDTCIAILEVRSSKLELRSNIVSSQVKIHAEYGGVYPTLAKREHQRNLIPVLRRALEKSNFLKSKVKGQKAKIEIKKLEKILEREEYLLKKLKVFLVKYQEPKIDLITVTVGPGLEPCLWTGVNFAKALSYFWNLPIIPINHIEAHIFANFIGENSKFQIPNFKNIFPAVCLVVSGGHTQLVLMKDFGQYKILGETRDDAAGECFDKVARILGLGYPGGPSVAKMATKLKIKNEKLKIKLPRPMINQKNFDFSFSGLKTAVLYDFKNRPPKIRQSREYIREMAAEVQQAIVDVLISKTLKAAKEYRARSIILGGGVAANDELRKQFNSKLKTTRLPAPRAQASGGQVNSKLNFLVPPKIFCTDNAAMVAIAGYFNYLKGKIKNWENIKVNANLRI